MTPERSKVDSALAECGTCPGQPPSSRHSPCRTGLQARSSSPGVAETGLETRSPFPPSTATPTRGLRPLTSYANRSETLRLKPQLLFHDARTLQSGFGFSRMCACHGQPPSSRHSPCRTCLQARSSSAGIAETGQETRSPFPPHRHSNRGLRSLTSYTKCSETLRLKPQLLFHDARTLQSGFGFSRMWDEPRSAAIFAAFPT